MPPKGKIPDADLAMIKKWIEGGAPETAVGAAKIAAPQDRHRPGDRSSLGKPDGPPPMPEKLPAVTLAKTERPTRSRRWPPARGRRCWPSPGTSACCSTTPTP